LGQVAHFARNTCSDEPLFTEVSGEALGFQLHFDGFKTAVEVIDLGIEGMVSIDFCKEVPLIQIVDSCVEDSIMGLGTPKHVLEPGG
jgi:hypothetical protein